ncbi:MAG: sigma-70 family RNA polymerase sigma factor, partial [Luminiphilus sp.]
MRQVSRGDRDAFAALVEIHTPALERFAMRMLLERQRAEEVLQETLMKAWQEAARYDPEKARLSTWLHQIAHNLCIDILRRQRREQPLTENADTIIGSDESPESLVQTQETQRQLTSAIGALSQRHRTALILTYYQSLPNRDVAQIMGISVRALES